MPMTDAAIRNLKPRVREYKVAESGGLYLLVTPSGGRLWRLKFRIDGREKKLAIGSYPEISLSEARKRKDDARSLIASGKDPSREKQLVKHRALISAGNTFGEIARELIDKRRREGMADSTAEKSEYYISRMGDTFACLPIEVITALDVLVVLRRIEVTGNYETARRVLQLAGRVFRFAVHTARLESDPTRDLRGALTAPTPKHYGAITDAIRAGALLRAIDGYEGYPATKLAMQLSPHVYVRPGELRHAEWGEINFEAALWTIPAEKMKMGQPHLVPLSRQSILLLRHMYEITGPLGYVFPSIRASVRPMSENTINAGLRRLGFLGEDMTAHGFRAMASTLLNESGKWSPDAIERSLAHGDGDKVRAAYHRGAHWQERVEMAQWWSDYLDTLRNGAEVLPFTDRKAGGVSVRI